MTSLFIAKLTLNNNESFIVTDGSKYSVLNNFKTFSALMNLSSEELFKIVKNAVLTETLDHKSKFLNLNDNDQLVFATGVTYAWDQKTLESKKDEDVYKKLYLNDRPMFFMKGLGATIAENHSPVAIRKDSERNIPEGEMVAVINSAGKIVGFTLGNDMTALNIEQANPMYQLQAKFYNRSCSLLPMMLVTDTLPKFDIKTEVFRADKKIADFSYYSEQFRKDLKSIISYLNTMNVTSNGTFLFLGCGASTPNDLNLASNDLVKISSNVFPIALENSCQNL